MRFTFDFREIVRTNKTVFIWLIFSGLFYLILTQGLFGLVFLTFILCFIFNNIIEWIHRQTRIPRRIISVLVYLVFVGFIAAIISVVIPTLGKEVNTFLKQLPEVLQTFRGYLDKLAEARPALNRMIVELKTYLSVEFVFDRDIQSLMAFGMASFGVLTGSIYYLLIGTLFSFLILYDYPNMKQQVMGLQHTRLREFYEETAGSVVRLGLVVGEAFQAQIMVASANTLLTAVGLTILGIKPVVLLSTIVFFAGLIPVLGTFISSVPILLLAINQGGLKLTLGGLVMILIVHAFENYLINPRIYAAIFKLSPVVVLIILFIGHSLFGMWGVLLGVPVSVFIYRTAITGINPPGATDGPSADKPADPTESANP